MSTLEHKNIYVNRGKVRSDSALDFTASLHSVVQRELGFKRRTGRKHDCSQIYIYIYM